MDWWGGEIGDVDKQQTHSIYDHYSLIVYEIYEVLRSLEMEQYLSYQIMWC